MGETLAQAAEREFGFNPDEPRGPGGKWIRGLAKVTRAAGAAAADSKIRKDVKANVRALKGKDVTIHTHNGGRYRGIMDRHEDGPHGGTIVMKRDGREIRVPLEHVAKAERHS